MAEREESRSYRQRWVLTDLKETLKLVARKDWSVDRGKYEYEKLLFYPLAIYTLYLWVKE